MKGNIMIKLTRIHGDTIYVHEGNIQWIENIPDTTITMINGTRFIVKESIEEILEKIQIFLNIKSQSQGQENSKENLTEENLIP